MVSSKTTEKFRFVDLPREIRDKIYRISLCTFGPRPTTITPPFDAATNSQFMNEIAHVDHTIDTSILCVSKQIHREAYDAMVKTNRFVRVTTSGGFPLRLLLNHLRVPVVTEDPDLVENFKGFVLSVTLTCPKDAESWARDSPISTEPCSFIMLGRDMDVFCDILMDGDTYLPGFGTKVSLKLAVAPGSILIPSPYKSPISEFFSETTQKALLQPFRNRLRGFKKAKVRGLVSRTIAEAVEEEMAQDTASDTEAVLSKYENLKDEAQNLYRLKQTEEACMIWLDAALEIEQLAEGSSWPALTEQGGVPFVARLAEIYFLMKLNIAHVKITSMQRGEPFAYILVDDALKMAAKAMQPGHWMPDFRWRPSDVHKAKLFYRQAINFRLQGQPTTIGVAVRAIDAAHRLLPEDSGIKKERDLISIWKASME